ncbi:MAG TPA: hypothetical protein VKH81_24465 [Candidatus Angelobacter sp.]|nr:hypothetical protein [Candidatus Angelobacter sp.]
MSKLVLRSCLLLFLALPLSGQSANWNIYTDSQGNFSVLFPNQPQDTINRKDETINSHTLLAKDGGSVYTVVYSSMSSDQKVDDATYQVFRDAVFSELPKCDIEAEHEPAPSLGGYIGHWYRLSCNMPNTRVIIEGNLYWGKRYAYAVMAMFPFSASRPQGEEKFLRSFAVLTAN